MSWWILRWEMRVRADTRDEAEALASRFAAAADQLTAGGRYDDFDWSLSHGDVPELSQGGTWEATCDEKPDLTSSSPPSQ